MVEAREGRAALRRFDPQAEPADFNRLFVEVDAVQVVFENPFVEVEERPMATELGEAIVRPLVRGVQLIEGLNEECSAATGRVENANRGQFVLPRFPETDQRGFRGLD